MSYGTFVSKPYSYFDIKHEKQQQQQQKTPVKQLSMSASPLVDNTKPREHKNSFSFLSYWTEVFLQTPDVSFKVLQLQQLLFFLITCKNSFAPNHLL